MRLFIAIELDESARQAIAAEQRRLKSAFVEAERSGLRWVDPKHMHLTLAFLGDVDDDGGDLIAQIMRRPIHGGRFAVVFGGLGLFPGRGAPRVLWLGLRRGKEEVLAVQRQVVERLERLGIVQEKRAFHPHLTLARWRKAAVATRGGKGPGRRVAETHRARESRDGGPTDRRHVLMMDQRDEVARLDVSAVTLVQSRLSSDGPTYSAVCQAQLVEDARPPLQSVP